MMADTLRDEENVIRFIRGYTASHKYAPRWEDVREGLGFKSKGAVNQVLLRLKSKGLIHWDTRATRTLVVVGDAPAPPAPEATSDAPEVARLLGLIRAYRDELQLRARRTPLPGCTLLCDVARDLSGLIKEYEGGYL
jgi:SOS-response transcriptional repressor LexA